MIYLNQAVTNQPRILPAYSPPSHDADQPRRYSTGTRHLKDWKSELLVEVNYLQAGDCFTKLLMGFQNAHLAVAVAESRNHNGTTLGSALKQAENRNAAIPVFALVKAGRYNDASPITSSLCSLLLSHSSEALLCYLFSAGAEAALLAQLP